MGVILLVPSRLSVLIKNNNVAVICPARKMYYNMQKYGPLWSTTDKENNCQALVNIRKIIGSCFHDDVVLGSINLLNNVWWTPKDITTLVVIS